MNKYAAVPIVLGVSAGLVMGEVRGVGEPHAEFLAVSPAPSANIVFTNVAATSLTYTSVRPQDFTPMEWKIPRDRLVVHTVELISPPIKK